MDKQVAVNEFLKKVRIALVTAGIYQADHPAFKKVIEAMDEKLRAVFSLSGSIEIGVKPQSLVIWGTKYHKERLYEDIAHFFHIRKIKVVKIGVGVSKEELAQFFLIVSASSQKLSEDGGLKAVLHNKEMRKIKVYELDYSPLLGEEQGGSKADVWDFLLNNLYSLRPEGAEDESGFARQLRDVFDAVNLAEDSGNFSVLVKFNKAISYLKDKWPGQRVAVNKELLRTILRKKSNKKDGIVAQNINFF